MLSLRGVDLNCSLRCQMYVFHSKRLISADLVGSLCPVKTLFLLIMKFLAKCKEYFFGNTLK